MSTPSPSLDPQVLTPLAPAFQIGQNDAGPVFDPAYSQVSSAMQTIHDSARLLGEAAESVKGARLDPGAERRLRASASSRFASAQKTIDAATNAIDARRAQLEGEIDGDLNIPNTRAGVVENLRANDIRARLRSMGSKAFDTVRAAIAASDLEAVSTVLAASPIASGLTYDEHRMIRSMAEQAWSPKRVAMRAGLEKLSATIARAGDVLASNYGHLLGEGDTREARKERALKALEGGAA